MCKKYFWLRVFSVLFGIQICIKVFFFKSYYNTNNCDLKAARLLFVLNSNTSTKATDVCDLGELVPPSIFTWTTTEHWRYTYLNAELPKRVIWILKCFLWKILNGFGSSNSAKTLCWREKSVFVCRFRLFRWNSNFAQQPCS